MDTVATRRPSAVLKHKRERFTTPLPKRSTNAPSNEMRCLLFNTFKVRKPRVTADV